MAISSPAYARYSRLMIKSDMLHLTRHVDKFACSNHKDLKLPGKVAMAQIGSTPLVKGNLGVTGLMYRLTKVSCV